MTWIIIADTKSIRCMMIGEYINMVLMLLILAGTFWILKSPGKKRDDSDKEDQD